jgi:hypothetical protein
MIQILIEKKFNVIYSSFYISSLMRSMGVFGPVFLRVAALKKGRIKCDSRHDRAHNRPIWTRLLAHRILISNKTGTVKLRAGPGTLDGSKAGLMTT